MEASVTYWSQLLLNKSERGDVAAVDSCFFELSESIAAFSVQKEFRLGAWEFGSFDNDDAMDWVDELLSSGRVAIKSAFRDLLNAENGYPEASECSASVAAAEVVAALLGYPSRSLPKSVSEWVQGKSRAKEALVKLAKESLRRILDRSELKDLWSESSRFEQWRDTIKDIQSRLK